MARNCDSVKDLHGLSTSSGISAGFFKYLGVDLLSFSDDDDDLKHLGGVQITLGIGVGVDAHTIVAHTEEIQWWDQLFKET